LPPLRLIPTHHHRPSFTVLSLTTLARNAAGSDGLSFRRFWPPRSPVNTERFPPAKRVCGSPHYGFGALMRPVDRPAYARGRAARHRQRLVQRDLDRLTGKTDMPADRSAPFRSNIRFIDGSNILATQPLEEIIAKAEGRFFFIVRLEPSDRSAARPSGIVPIDAIRHLEFVNREDRAAMRARYANTDPATIDALRTRIVYSTMDPSSKRGGKPKPFQKMFPIDIKQDLREAQKREIIGIGHARFLLSDEIVDARDLSEAELATFRANTIYARMRTAI
jgi:hypothetical protein